MRVFLILVWLTVPVLAWAYHLGPGQEQLRLERTQALLQGAQSAAERQSFEAARNLYAKALSELPVERQSESYPIRLELAKAQMSSSQLPEARVALEQLLTDIEQAPEVDAQLEREVRAALANAQYHMTWLMRLEGLAPAEWEPEIDASRQNYRLLAESAESEQDETELETQRQNLESAIWLARLDLPELQGLKIPKPCSGCCSNQCKKPGQKRKKKSNQPSAGASLGQLPDGSGS